MPVVHREDYGDELDVAQMGIGHVIAQKRAKLLENKTLHTQVSMAGTLFISSHDTRLRGGSNAATEDITLRRLAAA